MTPTRFRIAAAALIAVLLVIVFTTSRIRTIEVPVPDVASAPGTHGQAMESVVLQPESVEEAPLREAILPKSEPVAPPMQSSSGKVRIVGDIRDPSGKPIGAPMAVVSYRSATNSGTNCILGSDYKIGGFDPGVVRLDCGFQGFRSVSRRIVLAPGEGEHREDFVLEPHWFLDVCLKDSDGRELTPQSVSEELPKRSLRFAVSEGAPQVCWMSGTGELRRAYRLVERAPNPSGKQGVFTRLTILRDPPIYLSVDLHGYVLAATRLDSKLDRATLVVSIERLRGLRSSLAYRVVDGDTGSPIAGVGASLLRLGDGDTRLAPTATDETGRLQWADLSPGRCILGMEVEGRARVHEALELQPGLETDLGTIVLEPSLHVRGRFVDGEGRTLVGREFREVAHRSVIRKYSPEDPLGTTPWWTSLQITGHDDGSFEGNGFAKRRYLWSPQGQPAPMRGGERMLHPIVVDCTGGSVDDLLVTLDRGYPVSIFPDTDDARDLSCWILDEDGIVAVRRDLAGASTVWLASGAYRLLVGPDAAHVREIPFTVGASPMTIPIEP